MTLALLLTAVTGAWAQSSLSVVELEVPAAWANDNSNMTAADLPGFKASTLDEVQTWTGAPKTGVAYLIYAFDGEEVKYVSFEKGKYSGDNSQPLPKKSFFGTSNVKFYYPTGPASAEAPITVEWNASTKTGTFAMPAYDVEIAPIYAKAAAFATTGTEPEVKTLLPAAIEGIFAGTTDAIVKAGTVAMMGKTENPQGIVMYAVTSINQATAPALTAFSADVPTAEKIADEGADVLIWYYIQGANTPDGQEATAENTFNDSEIFAEPIKVTVLPNKYDIQFNAANANTIEAGKATVTVGGTAATVTEGKLQGVKMGSEVKVKANTGYKLRKVEVKKGSALKTLTVTGVATKSIYYAEGDTWQQAIERPENAGSGWSVQLGIYIFNSGLTLYIEGSCVRPEHTIDATKNYSLEAD